MEAPKRLADIHKFRATVPRLPVVDLTATFEFYVMKLGFHPLYRFGSEAGVGIGEIIVRFCKGEPIRNESLTIYVEIANTDELFERYVKQDVQVLFEPEDMPWGSRDFGIVDPDGYRLIFGDFRDKSKKRPPSMQMAAAIHCMQAGDAVGLRRMLDADSNLIQSKTSAPYQDESEATLLHLLIDFPRGRHPENVVEIAALLIEAGLDPATLDGATGSNALQLLMALDTPSRDEVELTRLLLDAGSPFGVANDDQHGMDAFTVALLNGHTECAALMFERGYPANFPWAGAGLGKMNLVRTFFGEGEDPALPESDRAEALGEEAVGQVNCAFLVAAINGQTEVVEELLNRGMDVNLHPPGSDFAGIGGTALHWAARNNRRATVDLLLERGADPNVRDDVFELTPAGWAAWFGHDDLMQALRTQES